MLLKSSANRLINHLIHRFVDQSARSVFRMSKTSKTSSKKLISSSSSFEKVLESPFTLRDMYDSAISHRISKKGNKKSHSLTRVKIKAKSAPAGRKLQRKKSRGTSSPAGPKPLNHISKKSYVLTSPTSPPHTKCEPHLPSTLSPLAKIDSPDLRLTNSTLRNDNRHVAIQSFRQSKPSLKSIATPSKSMPPSALKTPNKLKKLSSNSSATVTFKSTVKLSRNFSSIPPVARKHNSARVTRKNPFSFHREITGSSSYDGHKFTIYELAQSLKLSKFKKIVVMSGAGISTDSGIPDFRTPGTGLYDNLQQYQIPEPSAIFDITFFVKNPRPFFTLAKELYPGKYPPNIAHHFIRLLQDKGLLLRHYTQNIDGLERLAGIKQCRLVESHGSFATASCTVCQSKHDPDKTKELIFQNKIPHCKHKLCMGIVKPDIVFFGEDLPHRFHTLRHTDLSECDLLIVMGTSLEVEPFASLVTSSKFDVPRVLMNREVVGPFKHQKRSKDITLTGDISERITELARLSGWTQELKKLMKPPLHTVTTSTTHSHSEQVGPPSLPSLPLLPDKSHVNNSKGVQESSSNSDSSSTISDIVNDLSKLDIKDKR